LCVSNNSKHKNKTIEYFGILRIHHLCLPSKASIYVKKIYIKKKHLQKCEQHDVISTNRFPRKMDFTKELMLMSAANRIIGDHLEFVLDLEEDEDEFGPSSLPRRILKDRDNPLESMRPIEFR
jgi:hypothetical protein